MPNITQYSFASGEISPDAYARTDVNKYSISLSKLKNGFVRTTGGISNRPGLEFVAEVKDSSKRVRLFPFKFNQEQQYVIEAGEGYFRYIQNGGQLVDDDGNLVETESPFKENELFKLNYGQTADVLSFCSRGVRLPQELARHSNTDWQIKDMNVAPTISEPKNIRASHGGAIYSSTTTLSYKVTALRVDNYEESIPSAASPNVTASILGGWQAGEYVTISWDPVEDAAEYYIYKQMNGVYQYIGTSETTSFKDTGIEPDASCCIPIFKNPFDSSDSGNFPGTVGYFQNRCIFGNTPNNPNAISASQTGLFHNYNIQRPLVATNAVTIALNDKEINEIKHIVGMSDLIVFTSDSEWKVNGSDGIFQATPAPLAVKQTNYGCSDLMPIVAGSMILFCQAGGNIVRDLGYTVLSESYDGKELSYLANHLFEGKQIVSWDYSKEPYRILWCVMSDGTLNALTYNKEQEILGWHRHETDGLFESVIVLREWFEDVPYFVIKRNINGEEKRYIERMKSRIVDNAKDGFFVDCGLKQEFETPVHTVSGLDYLEGKNVVVLADGNVIEGLKVKNGSVNLGTYNGIDITAKKIVIGLPYEFELKTLNVEGEQTQGSYKNIEWYSVKVDKTREGFQIVGNDGIEQSLDFRSIKSINDPGYLKSGDIKCIPTGNPDTEVFIHIKQKQPLPITILSVTCAVEVTEDV